MKKGCLYRSFGVKTNKGRSVVIVRAIGAMVALLAATQMTRLLYEMTLRHGGLDRLVTLALIFVCTVPILSEGLMMLRGPTNNAFARIEGA